MPRHLTVIQTPVQVNEDYTLDLDDAGKVVEADSSTPVTITVPDDEVVDFPVGTILDLLQVGTGQLDLEGAVGVTLRSPATLEARAQWSALSLRKYGPNEWVVGGDLKPAP